jgi:TRAP-type C4-dicarboxylate transport system permease small subunit
MDNALPNSSGGPSAEDVQAATAFGRFVNKVANGAAILAGVAIAIILLLVCAEVALRPFGTSLLAVQIPVDEICGYLNAAAVFLALAYTLRDGGFIRVELVYDRLKGSAKKAIQWFIVLTGLAYVAALLYFTIIHVYYLYYKDVRAVSVIETPEWIPQTAAVIGLGILLLQLVAYVVNRVRNVP